jgi:hypothetical protein
MCLASDKGLPDRLLEKLDVALPKLLRLAGSCGRHPLPHASARQGPRPIVSGRTMNRRPADVLPFKAHAETAALAPDGKRESSLDGFPRFGKPFCAKRNRLSD